MTTRRVMGALLLAVAADWAAPGVESAPDTNWPGFRGPSASGIADGQHLPDTWSVATGANIRWKIPVPGLAHSSPIVSGDRIFVTSAVSSRKDVTFKPGLYGDGTASEDRTPQQWVVMAYDRSSGKAIWQRTAYTGEPKEKRHIKATYANATPFTDGRYVVAFFGSQGLYAFDMDGRPVWQKDLGVLNTGAYDLPEYEWGTASSPIIYKNLVIVQCDTQGESFVMASDVKTGKTVWKTVRKELPSWGTPTVFQPNGGRSRARDERLEFHPRLRSRYRRRAVAARWQLEDHGADAHLLEGPRHRRQRPRAGAADLRHQARRER